MACCRANNSSRPGVGKAGGSREDREHECKWTRLVRAPIHVFGIDGRIQACSLGLEVAISSLGQRTRSSGRNGPGQMGVRLRARTKDELAVACLCGSEVRDVQSCMRRLGGGPQITEQRRRGRPRARAVLLASASRQEQAVHRAQRQPGGAAHAHGTFKHPLSRDFALPRWVSGTRVVHVREGLADNKEDVLNRQVVWRLLGRLVRSLAYLR